MKIHKADYKCPTIQINWQTLSEVTYIGIDWILDQINNDPETLIMGVPYYKDDIDEIETDCASHLMVHMHDGSSWKVEIHQAFDIDWYGSDLVDLRTVDSAADEPWGHLLYRTPREKELLSTMEKALSLDCLAHMKTLLTEAIANAEQGEQQ